MLLNARGKMNTRELAEELETNPRNIREFKKELITAGYDIEEKRGCYGGYTLNEDSLFPSIRLTKREIESLAESRSIVETSNFERMEDYDRALDKIINSSKNIKIERRVYLNIPIIGVSDKEKKMIETAQSAKTNHEKLVLCYQSRDRDSISEYIMDPYEILHYEGAYYLLGWSHKRNDYRVVRFSQERMKKCEKLQGKPNRVRFLYDSNFQVEKYVGKNTIFNGKFKRVFVQVKPSKIYLFKEAYWGMDCKEESKNVYSFLIEDEYAFFRQLFSFGDDLRILKPVELKNEYRLQIKTILRNYEH